MSKNLLRDKYSVVTQIFHWLVALLVVGLFALGLWMSELDYYDTWYQKAPALHVSIGAAFLFLLIGRMINRVLSRAPVALTSWRKYEKILSGFMHGALYFLMVFMACSGYLLAGLEGNGVAVFDMFTLPSIPLGDSDYEDLLGALHEKSAFILIILGCGHGFFALKHHFYDKDSTLKRMLPR